MIGDIYKSSNISTYQPSEEVVRLTGQVKRAYNDGYEILHRTYEELNNMSVISRMNRDQRTFNSFVDESVEDPREAWKWRGTRSMARNRTMAMHAHLTSSYIIPNVFAQNDKDEADEEMAEIARDIMEWMTVNSNYRSSFLLTTMGMLVNPVTYMTVDFREVKQKVKCRTEEGWTKKEIVDEVLSGFDTEVHSADQILITNAYEQNIQRQRTIIKRRYVEYEEAEALYGDHDNWQYVSPGVKSIYNEEDGLFYDVKEDDNDKLVEIACAESRRDDSGVVFVNGIYMGDDDVEMNPIQHRDHRGAPKYNVTPFGYERINEHFFYYKSLVNNVGWDHKLLDALYEVTMNKEIMSLLPPVAISGIDQIDTDISMPGTVVAFENPDAKVSEIFPRTNNASGYNAMNQVENSIKEASISDTKMGQLPQEASQKAFSVAQAEQNAQVLLGSVGKTLGQSVAQLGQLMLDIGVNHLSTAQVDEITGDINYRNFILEDQKINGKKMSKKIIFSEALNGKQMSDKEKERRSIKLLEESGYPKMKESIAMVNPHLFSKRKYMVRVEPDTMIPKNQAFEQAMDQEMYTLLRQDPLVQPEQLIRDLLEGRKKNADDYIVEQPQQNIEEVMGRDETPQGETRQTQAGAQARSQALSPTQSGVV